MKKILIFIFSAAVLGFFLTACKPKVDVEKEKAAIKALIDKETQMWLDKNGKEYVDCYVMEEGTARASVSGSDMNLMMYDKKINYADSTNKMDFSDYKDYKFSHEILAVKIIDNVAWVIFKNHSSFIYKGTDTKTEDLQSMVMEKIDGKWKISCFVSATIQPPPPPPPPPPPAIPAKDKKTK